MKRVDPRLERVDMEDVVEIVVDDTSETEVNLMIL